ncbi:MAG: hypothetical protein ACLRSW_03100 [Christensenellaceae bacterium]
MTGSYISSAVVPLKIVGAKLGNDAGMARRLCACQSQFINEIFAKTNVKGERRIWKKSK